MSLAKYLPPDAYFDDPAEKLDGVERSIRDAAYGFAGDLHVCIKEWAARGNVRQRALRHDLVTLCLCPQFLPCKHPSAAWCGRQHGVSREYASRLCRDFARKFGEYIQFWNQRFVCQAKAIQIATGPGAARPQPGPVAGA